MLEAVVRSNWWEAGFGLVDKRLHGEAPCLLFRDTIKVFPKLAYNIMTKCHSRRDFRLFEDNFCVEEATPPTTSSSGHKEDASGTVQEATKTQEQGNITPSLRLTLPLLASGKLPSKPHARAKAIKGNILQAEDIKLEKRELFKNG